MKYRFVMAMAVLGCVVAGGCKTLSSFTGGGGGDKDERPPVRAASADEVSSCSRLGLVSAQKGGNFASYDDNVKAARAEIFQKAAGRKATHVVFDEPEKTDEFPAGAVAAMGKKACDNCVNLQGQAFVCKGQ